MHADAAPFARRQDRTSREHRARSLAAGSAGGGRLHRARRRRQRTPGRAGRILPRQPARRSDRERPRRRDRRSGRRRRAAAHVRRHAATSEKNGNQPCNQSPDRAEPASTTERGTTGRTGTSVAGESAQLSSHLKPQPSLSRARIGVPRLWHLKDEKTGPKTGIMSGFPLRPLASVGLAGLPEANLVADPDGGSSTRTYWSLWLAAVRRHAGHVGPSTLLTGRLPAPQATRRSEDIHGRQGQVEGYTQAG
ncbi:hypothetical protein METUNv1_02132 [Methyloversatilis universalis FAM5]|uniref:Uncharacterized protein n=1 Tax=Methyloversatilis universalis (strain ATCC BAA-1314 / DSM 25237 / JCM 13912 / CCUG 52030 / FAM5) TaxID=1000565 RepID=F5RCX6_METUF|nr:hypothetical protein METUNv1_02132 [Methyloversatilis universalis FAM5]